MSAQTSTPSPPHSSSQSPTGDVESDDDGLPENITIQLNLRKLPALAAHNRKIGDLPDPPPWQHKWKRDSYHQICARIRESIPTRLPGVRWPADASPYVKPSKHSSAKLFQILEENTYEEAIERAWRMERKRGVDPGQIVVHLFAYLTYPETRASGNSGGSGSTIQRATASRKAAAVQRIQQAVEDGQIQPPGPITKILFTQRLAQDARLPDPEEPLEMPTTATFVQAQHLDSQIAQEDRRRRTQEEVDGAQFKRIRLKLEDSIVSLLVDVESLRTALNLPQHGLNGLVHLQQAALPRPRENMEDLDHADSD